MASLGTAYIKIAPDLTGVQSKISSQLNQSGQQSAGSFGKGFSGSIGGIMGGAAKVGFAALAAGAAAAGVLVAKNIGTAITRIDTLVAFPRVLQAMDATAEEASKSTDTLAKKLKGLPTPLQDGAAGVQRLVAAGLGVGKATDVFLAFNNATLAAGTEAGAAQGAFQQLVQSISKGKIEGQEWNSLLAAMPTAFQGLAKSSGKTREELRELYRTDPQKLLDDLVNLNKNGGGGLKSLEEQARAATGGIKSAFANLNTTIAASIVKIVQQLGGGDLEAGQRKISSAIGKIGEGFAKAFVKVGDFFAFVIRNRDVFLPIIASVGAFIAISTTLAAALKAVAIVQAVLNAVTLSNPYVLAAVAIASLVAGLIVFEKRTGKISEAWRNLRTSVQPVTDYFMANVLPVLKSVGQFVGTQFKEAFDKVAASFGQLITAIQPFMPLLTVIGKAILIGLAIPLAVAGVAIVASTALLGALAKYFGILYSAALSAFSGALNLAVSLYGALQSVWNGIKGVFSGVSAFFSGVFNSAYTAVRVAFSTAVAFFAGVGAGIVGVFNGVVGSIRGIWSSIPGFFGGIANSIIGTFRSLYSGIVGALNSAVAYVRSIPGQIISIFSNIDLFASGAKMIGSFANGIKSAVGKAASAASEAVSKVRDLFPFSPAKTGPFSGRGYTTYSGEAIMKGLASGILAGSGSAVQEANRAMVGVNNAMASDYAIGATGSYASQGSAATASATSGTEYNIGTINISNEVDGERWLRKLTGNQEITSARLTPKQAYM